MAAAKILLVFGSILLVSRFGLPLGVALVIGGGVLDLWGGAGWGSGIPMRARSRATPSSVISGSRRSWGIALD